MRRAQRHETWVGPRARPGDPATSGIAGGGIAGGAVARGRVALGCAGLLALAVAAGGCGTHNRANAGHTPVNGGTATYALPANDTPNYIFPFAPGKVFTVVNSDNLQYLLYRPLYWWGGNGLPYLNEQLSLADEPTYHGQVVTIKLKPNLRWSDGSPVTAQDIMFWMNMMRKEKASYGGYVPHGLPDDIRDVHAVNSSEVQMTVIGKFSPLWFTDDELSQITPLPQAWDLTGPNTRGDCADNWNDCAAVLTYLNSIAGTPSKWPSSPVWKIVDGPWQLTNYSSQGVLTFTYNRSYSLRVPKDHITTFQEIPFTSEQAEFNQLQAGGSNPLDVGYLPTVDAPVPQPGATIGQNPVPSYHLQPLYAWGLSYIPYNFQATDPQLAIFSQQYLRQAFQLLVNQAAIIQGALHGYGVVSTGPVGDAPQTPYLSPRAKKGDPFPYNIGEAESLLRHHGWTVHPGGVTTCTDPGTGSGQCGPGVKAHAELNFTMLFVTGLSWVQAAVQQLKSNAALVGIQITLSGGSFDNIVNITSYGCGTATVPAPCQWELADWGQGWSYVPDYLPTGDELFETGSLGNIGQYGTKTDDAYIRATMQAPNRPAFLQAMYKWEDYLTNQLPVLLQPEAPFALVESINTLHIGVQSPTLALTPEDWYFMR